MNNNEFYCPLYEGNITEHDCNELCMGANFNHFKNEDLTPLMTIEKIGENRMICVHCQIKTKKTYSSNPEVIRRIEMLEEKYKDDDDALWSIEARKIDLAYLEKKVLEGNYEGQTPLQAVMSLERHLLDWH